MDSDLAKMLKAFEKKSSEARGLSDIEDDNDVIDGLSVRNPLDHFDDSDFEQMFGGEFKVDESDSITSENVKRK